MTVYAVYTSEQDEVEIHFVAETVPEDYGVPRSPVWEEVDINSIKVEKFYLFGHVMRFDLLPFNVQNDVLSMYSDLDWQKA